MFFNSLLSPYTRLHNLPQFLATLKSFTAQEGLILLTDLAHNILSWTHHWVLEGSPFADFGAQRMVDELMCIPGRVEIMGDKLQKVALLETHPYADSMRLILGQLLNFFDIP